MSLQLKLTVEKKINNLQHINSVKAFQLGYLNKICTSSKFMQA